MHETAFNHKTVAPINLNLEQVWYQNGWGANLGISTIHSREKDPLMWEEKWEIVKCDNLTIYFLKLSLYNQTYFINKIYLRARISSSENANGENPLTHSIPGDF